MKTLAFVLALAATITQAPKPLPLIGFKGVGYACPTEDAIYTARHVVEDEDGELWPFVSPYGKLEVKSLDDVRDLAILSPPKNLPRYQIANKIEPDAKVFWYQYNFRNKKRALDEERKDGKVLKIVSGHIVFDGNPVGGASGGCLLDENDQVVGIVIWNFRIGTHNNVGVAVDLTGRPKE